MADVGDAIPLSVGKSASAGSSPLASRQDHDHALDPNVALQQLQVEKDGGGPVGSRRRINFIQGTNVTLTIADNPASDKIDVTIAASGGGGGAPTDADYLVGTAHPDLSAEIVVGTTPGGELGGTWGSPTVDATHSGSAHHAQAHTVASHSDTTATGAETETLTDGSDADALHAHSNHGVTHNAAHGVAKHTGIVGERQVEIVIPLDKALPGATNNATLDDDYLYKKPYNVARRINKWYIRFESNLAAQATFELRKNGTLITGASITVGAAARDAAIDSFTETTLADGDSLEVWQTAGNAEDIGGRAYVYGDEDVVSAVS